MSVHVSQFLRRMPHAIIVVPPRCGGIHLLYSGALDLHILHSHGSS